MATTIHGYEGTGRGFELKTKPLLTKLRENVAVTTLVKPIRWREGDWLEASTNQLLLLDGKTTTLAVLRDKAGETLNNNLSFQFIPQEQLVKDQEQVEQIFTLLVDAHYQTSPQDLRNLLDSPNMLTFTLTFNNAVVAAAIISIEGNLPDDLIEGIWQGRRRPRGHLFPQSLICHSGFMQAGKFQFARIVRIAVLPEMQQQGIGSQLLAHLVGYFGDSDVDLLCTSFGLSEQLFSFWNKAGYRTVRLGLKAEASTGEKSIFMAKPLSSSSTNQMLHWQARFKQTMYVESNILDRRKEMYIPRDDFVDETLSDQDKLDLHVFAQHFRGLDSCLLALLKLAKAHVNFEILPDFVKDKLLKGLDNKTIIKSHGFSGEKQLVMAFRLWCAEALNRL
jgi:tRNA(Met) cytidine acetyltransferase